MNARTQNVNSILESLHINEKEEFCYIVTFSDGRGTYSRLLMSTKKVTEPQAEKYYKSFCKENNYEFYTLEPCKADSKMAKELISAKRVDSYD